MKKEKREYSTIKYHSRMSLSGIPTLANKQGADPRLQAAGMTVLYTTHAFTLIELLVVVLIIGILAAIALPQYQRIVEQARAREALVNLKTLVEAVNLYKLEHGEANYNSINDLDITLLNSHFFNYTAPRRSAWLGFEAIATRKDDGKDHLNITFTIHTEEAYPVSQRMMPPCPFVYTCAKLKKQPILRAKDIDTVISLTFTSEIGLLFVFTPHNRTKSLRPRRAVFLYNLSSFNFRRKFA